MSKLWIVPAILGAAVLTCGAGGSPTTSDRYAYSTYRERADRITILVDSYPAALHGEDRYIPLVVAIGLNDRREPVTVTPESFTLLDSRGSPSPSPRTRRSPVITGSGSSTPRSSARTLSSSATSSPGASGSARTFSRPLREGRFAWTTSSSTRSPGSGRCCTSRGPRRDSAES